MALALEHQKLGRGPAIVVLHGLFGMSDNWLTIAKEMQDAFTFYLVDQRNHGRSPHHEEHSYGAMAEDLKRFIEEHALNTPVVLGHSMGAKTAMRFALNYPGMLSKLISVDMAPRVYKKGSFSGYIDAMQKLKLEDVSSRKELDERFSRLIDLPTATRKFLLKNVYRDDNNDFRWRINLDVLCNALPRMMHAIEAQTAFDGDTLFIAGGESGYIKDDDLVDIRRLFPRATVKTIPGAGHWVHASDNKAFVKILRGFLAGQ